jgi:hypothetical protein
MLTEALALWGVGTIFLGEDTGQDVLPRCEQRGREVTGA